MPPKSIGTAKGCSRNARRRRSGQSRTAERRASHNCAFIGADPGFHQRQFDFRRNRFLPILTSCLRSCVTIFCFWGRSELTTVCIIPARMGSTRFPGKPLAPICGRPMIEHVYRRCRLNRSLDATYVATCDREIAQATEAFGGGVIMTSSSHERASDRVAEAAERTNADVIGMVQGDEPMIQPE